MALRAYFYFDALFCRASVNDFATSTGDNCFPIRWVNTFLHIKFLLNPLTLFKIVHQSLISNFQFLISNFISLYSLLISWWRELNPQPAHYKCAALPLSHTSRCYVIAFNTSQNFSQNYITRQRVIFAIAAFL